MHGMTLRFLLITKWIGGNVTNRVCNENIANNLIDKISELLDAKVNYYHCYDNDHRWWHQYDYCFAGAYP